MKLKAYTGRSLEEIAPQIREELGPGAVILSQRQGVRGGVGGFFGTKTLEVLAADRMPDEGELAEALEADGLAAPAAPPLPAAPAPATPSQAPALDVRDDGDAVADLVAAALAEATASRGEVTAPAINAAAAEAAAAYAAPAPAAEPDRLEQLDGDIVDEAPTPAVAPRPRRVAARPAPVPEPAEPSDPELAEVLAELEHAGVAPAVARSLTDDVLLHVAPFHQDADLRDLVRARIADDVQAAPGWRAGDGAHVAAFVGPSGSGTTSAVLKLAETYHAAGLAVGVVALGLPGAPALEGRLVEGIEGGGDYDVREVATIAAARAARKALADFDLVLIDVPGAATVDDAALAHVGKLLKALSPAAVHIVLPLSLAEREAEAAIARLAPLGDARLLVTKLDEARFAGPLVNLAHRSALPLSYLGTGRGLRGALRPADGGYIAARVLPIR